MLLLGATTAWAISSDSASRVSTVSDGASAEEVRGSQRPEPAGAPADVWRSRLDDALRRGVVAAAAFGGEVEVGLWLDNDKTPIEAGDQLGLGRLWSLSKPVAALAALEAADARGGPTTALMAAVTDAITKSDNCAQRLVVLDLQQREGGIDGAAAAFGAILKRAGVTLTTKPQQADISGDAECRSYLSTNGGEISDPFGTALQFGTDEWTLRDAILFAHALANGTYKRAGETVLGLMRQAKDRPAGASPTDYTGPLNDPPSGGQFPPEWAPAYKGGWGGHRLHPPNFRAAEIVVLDVGVHKIALAATFRPTMQPRSDDPGTTHAPQALNALFASIEQTIIDLEREP
jgi:hypothetical protein